METPDSAGVATDRPGFAFDVRGEAEILSLLASHPDRTFYVLFYHSAACAQCRETYPKFEAFARAHPSVLCTKVQLRDFGCPKFYTRPKYVPAFVLCSRYAGQLSVRYGQRGLTDLCEDVGDR